MSLIRLSCEHRIRTIADTLNQSPTRGQAESAPHRPPSPHHRGKSRLSERRIKNVRHWVPHNEVHHANETYLHIENVTAFPPYMT
jgi:hypothetical protein